MISRRALAFIRRHGVVLESARDQKVPRLRSAGAAHHASELGCCS